MWPLFIAYMCKPKAEIFLFYYKIEVTEFVYPSQKENETSDNSCFSHWKVLYWVDTILQKYIEYVFVDDICTYI
jgi:hypothetical protein